MKFNNFKERILLYLNSIFFPITLGLLSFLMWLTPVSFNFIFGIFYCASSFLPILNKDGRHYLPLILFTVPSISMVLTISSIPIIFYFIIGCITISMVVNIIIKKLPFKRGDILIPLFILFSTFIVSFVYNFVKKNNIDQINYGILYIVLFFFSLIVYSFLITVLGNGETINYYSFCVFILSQVVVLEIFITFLVNGFDFTKIELGWANNNSASTFLCLCLPFICMLINDVKKWFYIFPLAIVITTIVLLLTSSGIFTILILFVPLMLLTFKSYGRLYPYIVLTAVVVFMASLSVLFAFSNKYTTALLNAGQGILFLPSSAKVTQLNELHIFENIRDNLVLGSSIDYLIFDSKLVSINNTVLNTMIYSGIIGVIAYLVYDIYLFYLCFKKVSPLKYLFLVFLFSIEIIGLLDNTIYNFGILIFILVSNACYQMDNRRPDVPIHNSFYQNYNHPKKFKPNKNWPD